MKPNTELAAINIAQGSILSAVEILNVKISAKILQNVAGGMTVQEAYDSVFGKGAYMDMAGKMYDDLRAQ